MAERIILIVAREDGTAAVSAQGCDEWSGGEFPSPEHAIGAVRARLCAGPLPKSRFALGPFVSPKSPPPKGRAANEAAAAERRAAFRAQEERRRSELRLRPCIVCAHPTDKMDADGSAACGQHGGEHGHPPRRRSA